MGSRTFALNCETNGTMVAKGVFHYLTFKLKSLENFFKVKVFQQGTEGSSPSLSNLISVDGIDSLKPCSQAPILHPKKDIEKIIIVVLGLVSFSLACLFCSYVYRSKSPVKFNDDSVMLMDQTL